MKPLFRHLVFLAVGIPVAALAQAQSTRAAVTASEINAGMQRNQAADAFNLAQARTDSTLIKDKVVLGDMVAKSKANQDAYLQKMYRQNLPAGTAKKLQPVGEQILMFASASMPDGDMRSLLEDGLADKRIVIKFLGGEPAGGVPALTKWLSTVGHGLDHLPSIQIDPPSFHKYHVTQVPYAVILKDGKEVARVGGVYSTKWIDDELTRTSGDLGSYGAMTKPSEVDMEVYLADRIKHFDWKSYIDAAVANFWRDQKMPSVPHASKSESWLLDPTTTITHDIKLPTGVYLAHAGDKANPLSVAPLDATILVIDASDHAQVTYAHRQVLNHTGRLVVMSTAVPATAADGWAAWNQWQTAVGSHLYIYSQAFADRFKLSGTPAMVSGVGKLLKVQQIALTKEGAH